MCVLANLCVLFLPIYISPKVGKGYFRDVFAGEIYDQKVALKVLRSERSKSSTRNLLRHMREASILKAVHEQVASTSEACIPKT